MNDATEKQNREKNHHALNTSCTDRTFFPLFTEVDGQGFTQRAVQTSHQLRGGRLQNSSRTRRFLHVLSSSFLPFPTPVVPAIPPLRTCTCPVYVCFFSTHLFNLRLGCERGDFGDSFCAARTGEARKSPTPTSCKQLCPPIHSPLFVILRH